MARRDWYDDREELLATARWLEDHCEFNEPLDVIRFFEKPWHWTTEHDQMLSEERAAA